ncbi:SOS response-associated peptidase [Nesterenkonia sp. LB17]|uniref:SOS response-associated peptidase n=1 Tax=unclassified Nesterenkonia TaxID=2629769 RepID=UPI001F4C547E|nr:MULTISPECIES: SOS response-associated peptidase [unclassified Nesterenkonia]MCH8559199.1 SOS response-associated peptidase [Nesterenkonia sp. DZ6]MCH8565073.1 SOS response-associated peptidase [Nesterenkonia sp. LB17]
MCGRYVMAKDTGDLADDLNRARLGPVQPPAFEIAPNWNVAPTSTVPILVERYDDAGELLRELHPARWGLLPVWAKDMTFSSRTFNARSETVASKPSFRSAAKSRRCAVPAEAYYEWKAQGAKKRPHAIRSADGSPLVFAGLYEWWKDKNAEARGESDPWILSCTILTGPSPETTDDGVLSELAALHDRIPLAMTEEFAAQWIHPGEKTPEELEVLLEQLRGEIPEAASGWEIYEVDPAVGNVRNNGPQLLEPTPTLWR